MEDKVEVRRKLKLIDGLEVGRDITVIQTSSNKIILGKFMGVFDGLIKIQVKDKQADRTYNYFVNTPCIRAIKTNWDEK